MPLSARQLKVYIDRVNIYRPLAFNKLEYQDVEEFQVSSVPTYANVACFRETKPEFSIDSPIGRTDKDILFTIDQWHFHVDTDLQSSDLLEYITSGHPDTNQWFQILGDNMVKTWRAEKLVVTAKRVLPPKMI